jgi:hypothetical protein
MDTSFDSVDYWDQLDAEQAGEAMRALRNFIDRDFPRGLKPNSANPKPVVIEQRKDQVRLFVNALDATLDYMKKRQNGYQSDVKEKRLSKLWKEAGQAIRPFDEKLARDCILKGLGWTKPDVWTRAEAKGYRIGIPDMENALEDLLGMGYDMNNTTQPVPKWFPIAGVVFAAITVMFLMYLIVFGGSVHAERRDILNLLMAMSVAASAAFFGGDAAAKGKIPVFKKSPIAFSAVGGVGTFIVVYLILWYTSK